MSSNSKFEAKFQNLIDANFELVEEYNTLKKFLKTTTQFILKLVAARVSLLANMLKPTLKST